MWQLCMILAIWQGNSSIGGPMIIDGFKTEAACLAHMKKIEDSTPKVKTMFRDNIYEFIVKTCLKVDR